MVKIIFLKKILTFCSAATFRTPKSQLKVESNKKRGFEISQKNIERKLKTMWRLKWKKQWIEKHFTEKDKFGHCDMHRTYHEKDVIGDVVFEDYSKTLYLAKSMTEYTKISHEVMPV